MINNNPKILLVSFSDNSDHQDTIFGLYEELKSKNNVFLLAIKEPKVPLEKSQHTWLVNCPKRPGITKRTFDLKLLFSIIYKIRKEKIDIIYFESLHIWNIPIMLFAGNVKIYHVIHEVIPHLGDKQTKMVSVMNKIIAKLSNFIVLRNKTFIKDLIEQYGVQRNRIIYLELWRRYPQYTAPHYTKKMLFFGRINPYKGAENLLQIAKLCPNIKFEVIGKVDTRMEIIVEKIKRCDNVSVELGYVSDQRMREAFIDNDWLIVPYNSASQSGIIIDAYKYSRPVVAFAVGAIPEQVIDGVSGYLIEKGNNKAFAEKLQYIMSLSQAQYEELSKNAYIYGTKKYSSKGGAERFLKMIYKDL